MPSVAAVGTSIVMMLVGFMVGRFDLHTTVPSQVIDSFTEMEHKHTVLGALATLGLLYLLLLAPLYSLAVDESLVSAAYRYRTSSREHLRRRGSFG